MGAVFGERIDVSDIVSLQSKVIICTTNDTMTYLNLKVSEDFAEKISTLSGLNFSVLLQVLELIPGDRKTYISVDEIDREDNEEAVIFSEEYLHSLMPTSLPPHRLTLKVGSIVMLLRNLNIQQGICNGVRLVVRRMLDHVLDCELLTGHNTGTRVLIMKFCANVDLCGKKLSTYGTRCMFIQRHYLSVQEVGLTFDPITAARVAVLTLNTVKNCNSLQTACRARVQHPRSTLLKSREPTNGAKPALVS